jgi:hypothetical protein
LTREDIRMKSTTTSSPQESRYHSHLSIVPVHLNTTSMVDAGLAA